MQHVAIIGCGLIGQKRAKSLPKGSLRVVCDVDERRAAALAAPYGCEISTDWAATVARPDVEHRHHRDVARLPCRKSPRRPPVTASTCSLKSRPHAAPPSSMPFARPWQRTGAKVRVGFNHRYHRAFQQARTIVDSGVLGELSHVRARYGHGGRLGYEQEWRFKPEISGGGEANRSGHASRRSRALVSRRPRRHRWCDADVLLECAG